MLNKKNFYINGKWVKPDSEKEIKVINPANEDVCTLITLGNKKDIDTAVSAAKEAFKLWGYSPKEERIDYLEKLYTLYKQRWDDFTNAIVLEMGAPKEFASKLQVGAGAAHIKSFIKHLKEFNFDKPLNDRLANQRIIYEPKGVCALITLSLIHI